MPETSIDSQIGESVAHASHLPEQGRDRPGDNSAQRFESLKAEAEPGLELKADILGVSIRLSGEGVSWGPPGAVAEYMEQTVIGLRLPKWHKLWLAPVICIHGRRSPLPHEQTRWQKRPGHCL